MTVEAVRLAENRKFCLIPLHGVLDGKCTCGKSDCIISADKPTHAGKHPRIKEWQKKGSTDPQRIEKWAAHFSNCNWGVVTGAPSGVFVLDVDGELGSKSLSDLEKKYAPLPPTLTANTGRGKHLYFKHPGNKVKDSEGRLGKGLDIRGDGGMVVAPPSIHATGKRYEWVDADAPIASAPTWLLALVTTEDVPSEQIPEGERNPRLYEEVCRLFKTCAPEAVLPQALAFNAAHCDPPLAESKVEDIVLRVKETHRPQPIDEPNPAKHKSLHWFRFDALEFITDQNIRRLTDSQLAWRTRLLPHAWLNGGRLLNDAETLADFAKATGNRKFKAELLVALFDFEKRKEDGKNYLVSPVMREDYAQKLTTWKTKRDAGHRGGNATAVKYQTIETEEAA